MDFLKEKVFLPFTALEDVKKCIIRGDPYDYDENEEDISPVLNQEDKKVASEPVNELPHKICTNASSPILPRKPYSFARPKVTFTMEDLEHSSSDDNDVEFEKNVKPGTSSMRSQPKRSCNIDQNLAFDQSVLSEDEQVKNSDSGSC